MNPISVRKFILAIGAVAAMAVMAGGPARADDDHWRGRRHEERDWREHERHDRWERRYAPPPVIVAPPRAAYVPPPVVVVPPPSGLNIVLPITIR